MEDTERAQLASELLRDLAPLFRDRLAAEHWGRLLVGTQRREQGDGFRVVSLDVEDIFGDEEKIEAAFGQDGPHDLLPMLARATETLASLRNISLDEAEGGTFLQSDLGAWAWLPGLVRTPSQGLERTRDDTLARLRERHARLPFSLGRVHRADVDVAKQFVRFYGDEARLLGEASTLLLGSFSSRSHQWCWAWAAHDALPPNVRQACKDTVDHILDRDLWELSTEQFATDEATVWALSAFVCVRTSSEGVFRVVQPGGAIYLLLRAVTAAAEGSEPS